VTSALRGLDEDDLLERAQAGDEGAFQSLVEPRRTELHAHCYRMLGSTQDAEDALQETLLKAWRALPKFQARSSLRSWLYKIATNTCLNQIERRPKRVLAAEHSPPADPHDGPGRPLVESVWIEPYPDEFMAVEEDRFYAPEARYEQRESVELAFVAALQHLPPLQRAALIQAEVLGFSAREVAESLETTVPSVNSALQRARKAVEEKLPEQSQQETLRTMDDDELKRIVDGYMEAWEAGDVDTVASMLAEDAILTMPPMATWYDGRDQVRVFLSDFAFAGAWRGDHFDSDRAARNVRLVPTTANGQLAFGAYRRDADGEEFKPYTLQVLRLRGKEIVEVTGFVSPDYFRYFSLPDSLPADR
jgi:RNA polymerase sigma-70 factor (ECF subfamily)